MNRPGFSGGNTERPGLKRLMADIERGLVDIVVVYKIDRLTRSLADFSKMVEVFERQGVSFVSVTQQFNPNFSLARARRMMGGEFDWQIEPGRLIPEPLHPLPVLHGHRQIQYGLAALGGGVGGFGK